MVLLGDHNIVTPTPIQSKAIPVALTGGDVVGIAQTGTGKTLAFALPMIQRLHKGQVGLIMAPTRELAEQICETFRKLGEYPVLVIGGAAISRQVKDLKRPHSLIVATPGRLIDHIQQGNVRLNRVAIVVLDEADRMLDMGFAPAIKQILRHVPKQRQTMLFSATVAPEVMDIAQHFMVEPVTVEVASQGQPSELVDQEIIYLEHGEKNNMFTELLYENKGSILVFARTRYGARNLARKAVSEGHRAAEIHSDRTLNQRREALRAFKSGEVRILVATDIAARGIDVHEISLVVNYDVPEKAEDYVHRIGRTGRAGFAGRAITLAIPQQARDVQDIESLMGLEIPMSSRSTVARPAGRGARLNRHARNQFSEVKPQSGSGGEAFEGANELMKSRQQEAQRTRHVPREAADRAKPFVKRDDAGKFDRNRDSKPFVKRDDAGKFDLNRDSKPFVKRDDAGKFDRNRDAKPYAKRDDAGKFDRNRDAKPFAKRDDAGKFDRNRDAKPYAKRDDAGKFDRNRDSKPYAKRDDAGKFDRNRDAKPFAKRDDAGKFDRNRDAKPFVKRDDNRRPPEREHKPGAGKPSGSSARPVDKDKGKRKGPHGKVAAPVSAAKSPKRKSGKPDWAKQRSSKKR